MIVSMETKRISLYVRVCLCGRLEDEKDGLWDLLREYAGSYPE